MEKRARGIAPKKLDILETEFGTELTLTDEEGADPDSRYQILRELDLDGRHYAVLRSSDSRHADAWLFRVTGSDDGRRIEHVEDDAEWDEVADAIEDMLDLDEG